MQGYASLTKTDSDYLLTGRFVVVYVAGGAAVLIRDDSQHAEAYCGVRICLSLASKAGLVLTRP
jgi:hypothetical protein